MNRLAIFDYFGYELPMSERYKLIRESGFGRVTLGWAGFPENPDETKQQNPGLARRCGLVIENLHTPFINANDIWLDTINGEDYFKKQLMCLDDCMTHEIPAMILHIDQGMKIPPISSVGLHRINTLACRAEKKGVDLAFENMRNTGNLRYVLNKVKSKRVKFCYDAGHQNCKTPNEDLLTEFGDRVAAVHLHDNNGLVDQHDLPFNGTINWIDTMDKLMKSSYREVISLEVINGSYLHLSPFEFLKTANERAERLLEISGLRDI